MNITKSQIISMILILLFSIFSSLLSKELIVIIPLLIVFMFNYRTNQLELFYCSFVAFIFSVLIKMKFYWFPMFPQVSVLFSVNKDLLYWFRAGNVHAVRLAIVYPGVLLGRFLDVNVDLGVTIYSSILMILIVYFMLKMLRINGMENHIGAFFSVFFILALAYFMNGRLIFVFFGISLLVLYDLKFKKGEVSIIKLQIVTVISVFFTLVSSGTMMIAIAYAIFIVPYRFRNIHSINEKRLFLFSIVISIFPIIIILIPYIIKMTMRNIEYYGGGFRGAINLINHGLGKFVDTDNTVLVLILFFIGVCVVIINFYLFRKKVIKKDKINLPLLLSVNLSLYGSIFGLSTGLTALIPFLVLIIMKMNNILNMHKGEKIVFQKSEKK